MNSRAFHAVASTREGNNKIKKLKGTDEEWKKDKKDVVKIIYDHFNCLFASNGNSLDDVLSCMPRRVMTDNNNLLLMEFTLEEVKDTLFVVHPDKALGLDGMNLAFFKRNWEIVRANVI